MPEKLFEPSGEEVQARAAYLARGSNSTSEDFLSVAREQLITEIQEVRETLKLKRLLNAYWEHPWDPRIDMGNERDEAISTIEEAMRAYRC